MHLIPNLPAFGTLSVGPLPRSCLACQGWVEFDRPGLLPIPVDSDTLALSAVPQIGDRRKGVTSVAETAKHNAGRLEPTFKPTFPRPRGTGPPYASAVLGQGV